jgi:outer membrane protein assembly factor BamB
MCEKKQKDGNAPQPLQEERMKKSVFVWMLFPLLIPSLTFSQVGDSPWPMFRHDLRHTGRSPYTGPGSPAFQWSYQTDEGVASSPAIGADGTIYVGSGWYFLTSTDSALYALNVDGGLKWKYYAERGIFSSPAVDKDGTIYFGSFDNYLYAVEDSISYGRLKWRTRLGFWVMSSPAIADDGTIYVGDLNFNLAAVDSNGHVKWADKTGWCIFSSPAIGINGVVYVGSKDHYLYAYEDLGDDYNRLWRHAFGSFYDGHLVDASPAIGDDGTIYIGTDPYGAAGTDPVPVDTSLFAVNPDGTRKWAFPTGDGVESSPAIGHDGTIYFGSFDSCVYAIRDEGDHGRLLWKFKTGGPVDASPTVGGDGTIYIGSRDSILYAFNPDGSILWAYDCGGDIESSVTIAGDGRIYFGGMDGKVYALGDIGPDVGLATIDIPDAIPADTTIVPGVTAHNFRMSPESFRIILAIEDSTSIVYLDTLGVTDLAGGQSYQALFAPWLVGKVGESFFHVIAFTVLSGDNNGTNDTLFAELLAGAELTCGDVNADDRVDMLDILYLMAYLYKYGAPPDPTEPADVNNDGDINMLDILYLVAFLYKSGPAPDC